MHSLGYVLNICGQYVWFFVGFAVNSLTSIWYFCHAFHEENVLFSEQNCFSNVSVFWFAYVFWIGNDCTWITSWSLVGTLWEDEHRRAGATDRFQVQKLCSSSWQSTEELWIFQWMGRFNISTWKAEQGMSIGCLWEKKKSGIDKECIIG